MQTSSGISRESAGNQQGLDERKNPGCGFEANADWNAARNILHLYRIGHVAIPAAGTAVAGRARRVKPATARQAGISRLQPGEHFNTRRTRP
ncbi:hypothetical protein [Streptomyces sp. NBC_01235]|uniref:hypothetical protein n=1 Tax=Streptomyces sp. NBC_01235 TaxID=2903788 RepID=UPI003FA37CA1